MNTESELYDNLKQFDAEDLIKYVDFASNAAAYGYIAHNAQDYVRNIQVADLLNTKFLQSGIFKSAKDIQDWISDKLSADPTSLNNVYRMLEGHGAGEVDFVRYINGSLKSLLYKAEFATNEAGAIVNNVGGIDVVLRNRFTDEIVQRIQVKSNWSNTAGNLRNTINEFVNGKYYSPDIILAGPKELIDKAKEMGLPNPTQVFHDTGKNLESAEKLKDLAEKGKLSNTLFSINTIQELGEGALIGAAISLGVSSVENYISYRNGLIDMDVAFNNIASDSARGAVVGVALKGVALLCPPGLIGIGIAIVIGSGLRKVIDITFGKGDFEKLLKEMQIDNSFTKAYTNFAITTFNAFKTQRQFASVMNTHANNATLIDQIDKSQDIEIEKRLKEI